MSSDHSLVRVCAEHGYPVEFQRKFDGSADYSTVVVEFPFSYPEGTVLAEEMSAIDQLEWVRKMQTVWSDNAVSCTVYYTPEELPSIKEYLSKYYNDNFKSLSFLLRDNHGFDQAPIEKITKEEYDRRVATCRTITGINSLGDLSDASGSLVQDCAGGACPVR